MSHNLPRPFRWYDGDVGALEEEPAWDTIDSRQVQVIGNLVSYLIATHDHEEAVSGDKANFEAGARTALRQFWEELDRLTLKHD